MSSNRGNETCPLTGRWTTFFTLCLLLTSLTQGAILSKHGAKSPSARNLMQFSSPLMNSYENYIQRQDLGNTDPVSQQQSTTRNQNITVQSSGGVETPDSKANTNGESQQAVKTPKGVSISGQKQQKVEVQVMSLAIESFFIHMHGSKP